jgi:hypothetical protein
MRLIEDGHMQDSKRPRGTIGAGRADVTAPPPASFSTSQGHQAKEPPLPGVDVSQLTNVEGINFIIRAQQPSKKKNKNSVFFFPPCYYP